MPVGGKKIQPIKAERFEPVPDDKYTVLITDVNEVTQFNKFKNEDEVRLNFEMAILDDAEFEYEDENGETKVENVRGRKLWWRVTPSLSPGIRYKASHLYKLLCAVEGRDLDQSELHELDPDTLIGQQVSVFVEVNGEYNNVSSVMHARKKLDTEGIQTVYDRADEEADGGPSKPEEVRPETREKYNKVANAEAEDVQDEVDGKDESQEPQGWDPDEETPRKRSRLKRKSS